MGETSAPTENKNWNSALQPPYHSLGRGCAVVSGENKSCSTVNCGNNKVWTEGSCNKHKSTSSLGWGSLSQVNTGEKITPVDIQAGLHALNTAIAFWKEGSDKIVVNSGNPVSISGLSKGNKITAAQWNAVISKLDLFSTKSNVSLSNKGSNDTITAQDFNDIKEAYNNLTNACKCNSDKGIEECVCDKNCRCNY